MSEFRSVPVYRGGVKVNFIFWSWITLNILDPPQACIFDWAGTVCDAGVFAPVLTFQKLFEDEGVPITTEEVRAPMGVHKRVSTNKYYVDLVYFRKKNSSYSYIVCFLCPGFDRSLKSWHVKELNTNSVHHYSTLQNIGNNSYPPLGKKSVSDNSINKPIYNKLWSTMIFNSGQLTMLVNSLFWIRFTRYLCFSSTYKQSAGTLRLAPAGQQNMVRTSLEIVYSLK